MTDCYGFHYSSLNKEERRKRIAKWFNFQVEIFFISNPNHLPLQCNCSACGRNFPVMSNLTSKLSQKSLEFLKDLLEKFQWALKHKYLKKSLDISIQYLQKLSSLQVKQPHKAWEAGSHALSCSLWALYRNNENNSK